MAKYVNVGQVTPERILTLAPWMDEHGLAGDLLDEKYQDATVVAENQSHIRGIFETFLASIPRDEAYRGLQQRGSNAGAIRSPDEVMQDPHLEDRGFWTDVEYPELGKTLRHPGPGAIFNGSPWSDIPARASHRGAQRRGPVRGVGSVPGGVGRPG